MSYNPVNPNGQETSANSAPVVIASDQSAIAVTASSSSQTKLIDGTNTANVVPGDTGFNGVLTGSAAKTYTFSTSSSGAQTLLANTLCEGFAWINIYFTSVGTGLALGGQFAATSGGTYITTNVFNSSGNTQSTYGGIAVNTAAISSGPVLNNYFQLAITALTSGTVSGYVVLSATASGATSMGVTTAPNSSVGSATPSVAYSIGISDGTNLQSVKNPGASGASGSGLVGGLSVAPYVYNGSTYDIFVSAAHANTTTGTGVIATGTMLYNGTDFYTQTTNSTTYSSKYGADVNLLGTLGTAFTTAGKIDITAIPTGTNSIGTVGTTSASINVGQQTVNTTAVQVNSTSTVPTNGILAGALSTNSASIFIGGSGVTTSNGAEIQPGGSLPFTCNLNALYIISAASTTDKIWYSVT